MTDEKFTAHILDFGVPVPHHVLKELEECFPEAYVVQRNFAVVSAPDGLDMPAVASIWKAKHQPATPGYYPDFRDGGHTSLFVCHGGEVGRNALDVFYSLPYDETKDANFFVENHAQRGHDLNVAALETLGQMGLCRWGDGWGMPNDVVGAPDESDLTDEQLEAFARYTTAG